MSEAMRNSPTLQHSPHRRQQFPAAFVCKELPGFGSSWPDHIKATLVPLSSTGFALVSRGTRCSNCAKGEPASLLRPSTTSVFRHGEQSVQFLVTLLGRRD